MTSKKRGGKRTGLANISWIIRFSKYASSSICCDLQLKIKKLIDKSKIDAEIINHDCTIHKDVIKKQEKKETFSNLSTLFRAFEIGKKDGEDLVYFLDCLLLFILSSKGKISLFVFLVLFYTFWSFSSFLPLDQGALPWHRF